jgi:hypothetical protein
MRIATLRLSLDQNEIERGIMDPGTIGALAAVLVALTALIAEIRRWRKPPQPDDDRKS